jgi:hypothetical protein
MARTFVACVTPSCLGFPISTMCHSWKHIRPVSICHILWLLQLLWLLWPPRLQMLPSTSWLLQQIRFAGLSQLCLICPVPAASFFGVFMVSSLLILSDLVWCLFLFLQFWLHICRDTFFPRLSSWEPSRFVLSRGVSFECTDGGLSWECWRHVGNMLHQHVNVG